MTGVYPPSEDSLFLLKAVERSSAARVAEVGVGSGFVLHHYILSNSPELAVGTDIDGGALNAVKRRDSGNSIELVQCHACEALRNDAMDLVFSNPPYLRDEGTEDLATSGGVMGIETTYALVLSSLRVLVPGGRMIFLVSSLSNVKLLRNILRRDGIVMRRMGRLPLFFEELYSVRVVKAEFSRRPLSRRRLQP